MGNSHSLDASRFVIEDVMLLRDGKPIFSVLSNGSPTSGNGSVAPADTFSSASATQVLPVPVVPVPTSGPGAQTATSVSAPGEMKNTDTTATLFSLTAASAIPNSSTEVTALKTLAANAAGMTSPQPGNSVSSPQSQNPPQPTQVLQSSSSQTQPQQNPSKTTNPLSMSSLSSSALNDPAIQASINRNSDAVGSSGSSHRSSNSDVVDIALSMPATATAATAVPGTTDQPSLQANFQPPLVVSPKELIDKFVTFEYSDDNVEELVLRFRLRVCPSPGSVVNGLMLINSSSFEEFKDVLQKFTEELDLPNPNAKVIGDIAAHPGGQPVIVEWDWKYAAPRSPMAISTLQKGKLECYRNSCCFLEYDPKRNDFNLLASFQFASIRNSSKVTPLVTLGKLWNDHEVNMRRGVAKPAVKDNDTFSEASRDKTKSTVDRTELPKLQDYTRDSRFQRSNIAQLESKSPMIAPVLRKIIDALSAYTEAEHHWHSTAKDVLHAVGDMESNQVLKDTFCQLFKGIEEVHGHYHNAVKSVVLAPLENIYEKIPKQEQLKKKSAEYQAELKAFEKSELEYLAVVESETDKKKSKADRRQRLKRKEFELKRFDYLSMLYDVTLFNEVGVNYHLSNYLEKFSGYLRKLTEGANAVQASLAKQAEEARENIKYVTNHSRERAETKEGLTKEWAVIRDEIARAKQAQPRHGSLAASFVNQITVSVQSLASVATGAPSTSVPPSFSSSSSSSSTPVPTMMPSVNGSAPVKIPKNVHNLDHTYADPNYGRKKEGFLYAFIHPNKTASQGQARRIWVTLNDGKSLMEYHNWQVRSDMPRRLSLENCTIKFGCSGMKTSEEGKHLNSLANRRFLFEIIWAGRQYRLYQAATEDEAMAWVMVLRNIANALITGDRSQPEETTDHDRDHQILNFSNRGPPLLTYGSDVTEQIDTIEQKLNYSNGNGDGVTFTSPDQTTPQTDTKEGGKEASSMVTICGEAIDTFIRDLRRCVSNNVCSECSCNKPVWCVIHLGILVCHECAGILRKYSNKVRSLYLDTNVWTPEMMYIVKAIGNSVSNSIWEADLRESKPVYTDSREMKDTHITSKYIHKRYTSPCPIPDTNSPRSLSSVRSADASSSMSGVSSSGPAEVSSLSQATPVATPAASTMTHVGHIKSSSFKKGSASISVGQRCDDRLPYLRNAILARDLVEILRWIGWKADPNYLDENPLVHLFYSADDEPTNQPTAPPDNDKTATVAPGAASFITVAKPTVRFDCNCCELLLQHSVSLDWPCRLDTMFFPRGLDPSVPSPSKPPTQPPSLSLSEEILKENHSILFIAASYRDHHGVEYLKSKGAKPLPTEDLTKLFELPAPPKFHHAQLILASSATHPAPNGRHGGGLAAAVAMSLRNGQGFPMESIPGSTENLTHSQTEQREKAAGSNALDASAAKMAIQATAVMAAASEQATISERDPAVTTTEPSGPSKPPLLPKDVSNASLLSSVTSPPTMAESIDADNGSDDDFEYDDEELVSAVDSPDASVYNSGRTSSNANSTVNNSSSGAVSTSSASKPTEKKQ